MLRVFLRQKEWRMHIPFHIKIAEVRSSEGAVHSAAAKDYPASVSRPGMITVALTTVYLFQATHFFRFEVQKIAKVT